MNEFTEISPKFFVQENLFQFVRRGDAKNDKTGTSVKKVV